MFHDADLLAFRARRTGWINPAGALIVCDTWQHFVVLGKQERYAELYQQAEEAMEQELSYLEPGEHPAMHRFDSEYEARNGVINEAYREGWVRLGSWSDEYAKLEAHSTVATLTLQIERIKFLADVLGYSLICRDENDRKLGQKVRAKLGIK